MNKEQFLDVMDGIGDDLIENFLDIPGERIYAPKRGKKNAALRSLDEKEENSMTKRKFRLKPLIIVTIATIVGLLIITGAASIIRHNGFLFDEGNMPGIDFFVMIVENAGEAPDTIQKICYDNNLPSKYKEDKECPVYYTPENDSVCMQYYATGSALDIIQSTKRSFTEPVVPKEDVCAPVEIKGYNGFTIVHTDHLANGKTGVINEVIWDCGEYIHMVVGYNISMEEIMSIIDGMTEK